MCTSKPVPTQTHRHTYRFSSRYREQIPANHVYMLPSTLAFMEPKLEGTPLHHPTYDTGKVGTCLQDMGTSEGCRLRCTNFWTT